MAHWLAGYFPESPGQAHPVVEATVVFQIKRLTERAEDMGLLDTLTGRSVEERIAQYSEVYGEILLGLHRDKDRHETLIQNLHRLHTDLTQETGLLADSLKELGRRVEDAESEVANKIGSILSSVERLCSDVSGVQERQDRLVQETKQHLNALREETHALTDRVNGLESRFGRALLDLAGRIEEYRGITDRFRAVVSEAESNGKRFRTLGLLCGLSCVFVVIWGLVLWMIR